MSRSNDTGHFFQTTDSLATKERKTAKSKNKNGNPIALPSKILAIHADPFDDGAVFVAEAAGTARRVVLDSGDTSTVFTGATAPLTSLAISYSSSGSEPKILFAGCWDKTIHSWSLSTRQPLRRYTNGHTDFVKCVLSFSLKGTSYLISGGADANIIVWNVASGAKLHVLKGHIRGILDLAIDPYSSSSEEIVLFSASSDREIRSWKIMQTSAQEIAAPILAHATSVNKLRFEGDVNSEGDLWTASADKTAAHLVRSRNWESDTTLQHPDFVRDVVFSPQDNFVVTACRDEEVRVWNASSGDLAERGNRIVSVSIDGTVRVWSLEAEEVKRVREEAERAESGGVEVEGEEEKKKKKKEEGMLTAEEEAELAELMEDDD
ncbi:hypothetical protein H2203_001280 [Taxawa tesnikishii (nom. ined.)]|nr:hypothetical protein H2203_001280 [Dothideales sp. JES 119]